MAKNSKALRPARVLRKKMTRAEKILWQELRGKKLSNFKFRRQMPLVFGVYHFVADFYCAKKKAVIEVDGEIHNNPEIREYDILRESIIKEMGYKIIRFKNEEVENNLDEVLEKLKRYLEQIKIDDK